jgi:hypothetical protein
MQITASLVALFNQLNQQVQAGLATIQATSDRLQAVQRSLAALPLAEPETSRLAGITTRSVMTPDLSTRLFEEYAPPVSDTLAALFSHEASPLDWHNVPPATIETALLAACSSPFAPIGAMSIEQIISHPASQATSESYYTWLVNQATPSWNLDRTRLPEGGAALQRVQVLGVPDETVSNYRQRTTSLVSTGDPGRITAFAAHIGATHTALQQWENYHLAYEQARGQVPLHILPQFQTDNERARQTFALGSLFNLIKNQGAYFYYIPADPLARPVKLAQGLANSLKAFTQQEGLVQEARERLDQIVASQGIETTLRHLKQYYESDNGRDPTDDLVLELKRLVRAYAEELGQIYQFAAPTTLVPDKEVAAPSPNNIPRQRELPHGT